MGARVKLARRYCRVRQLRARGAPDPLDAGAGIDEDRSRRECDKSHQQGVFDQVLALFVLYETHKHVLHLMCPPLSCWLSDLAITGDRFRDRAITDFPLVTGNERTC